MQDQTKVKKCVAPNLDHTWQFAEAGHGYSCWVCIVCGDATDEMEDTAP